MDLRQTGQLLVRASVVDNRRVEEETIHAWHEVLADVDYTDAVDALLEHRRTSTEYLLPAHITRILATRRRTSTLRPATPIEAAADECDIHVGYPLIAGACLQCDRYPDDRDHYELTGERPAMLPLAELEQIGRHA